MYERILIIKSQIQASKQIYCKMGKQQTQLHFNDTQPMPKDFPQKEKQFATCKKIFHVEDIKFPLSTSGIKIVDANGTRVKLAGTNWSGGHMERHCVAGLEYRRIKDIVRKIRDELNMNCVRLCYSLQMFFDNNVIDKELIWANPQFFGMTSMQIFDQTVKQITDAGLMVILNNHTSTSQWCCDTEDGDGLWWSKKYDEKKFLENAQNFAKRYAKNQRVIGTDLRNQIRQANGLTPTWGMGSEQTDWHAAAKRCADVVQKICPHWLIFVGGLNYQLDLTACVDTPLVLNVANKLIYTGHFYDFQFTKGEWDNQSDEDFKKHFYNIQTCVRGMGVPYFLGQFGDDKRTKGWKLIIKYLQDTDIDYTYWCLDGFKCKQKKEETYGILTYAFDSIRHKFRSEDLGKICCHKRKC